MKPPKARRRIGGRSRLGAVLFGALFLAAGLFFLKVAVNLVRGVIAERTWPRVAARVEASSFDSGGGEEHPYRFVVRYRYRFGGGEYVGTVFQHAYVGSADARPVELLRLRYPPGAHVTCRVNPANPVDSVLKPRSSWLSLMLLLPIPFILIGVVVLVGVLSRRRVSDDELGARATVTRPGRGRGPVVFGVVVFLAGFAAVIALSPWVLRPLAARHWRPVHARVLSSSVRRHEKINSGGTADVTWKLDILYEYRFGGRRYRSNAYDLVGGSSSGYYGKRDIARRYPSGSTVTAWVNPHDPTRATLRRSFSPVHLLFLIPLGIMAVGAFLVRRGLRAARRRPAAVPGVPSREPGEDGSRVLRPGKGRAGRVLGFLFLVLFWNGIVSVFLWDVVQGFRHGRPPWFETVFLIPFVLTGLILLGAFVHAVLALANPRITLTVLTPEVRLGQPLRIAWHAEGRLERPRRLRITFEGQEKASYRRGTDTHTDTSTFRTIVMAAAGSAPEMRSGEAEATIPEDTMHTFRGRSNWILWRLVVHGKISHWPDVKDSWEVEVLPLAAGEV